MRTTPRALAAALAGALLVTGCSSSDDGDPTPPSYDTSDSVHAEVLPQLAANGEDVESAADAAWVVDATIDDVDEGTAVTLVAKDDDGWSEVDEQETDDKGRVTLTSRDSGDLHVMVGDGDDAIGTEVSTDDAPEATFTDDFDDESTLDDKDGSWHTRDQGYTGVRTCSRASADAAEVADGVLRLSVTEDPERKGDECQLPGRRKKFAYRLNGHVGTEGRVAFTYGFAAARIKTQAGRGQHSAFWMQTVGGQGPGGPEKGGAEIDVIEYFGDDHPEGGLTSFTYFLDKQGKKQTVGGWLPNADELGDDWASKYHVFSVEWTPEEYVFRIDGKVTQRLKGVSSGKPEFLILSLLSSDYELPRFDGDLPQTMEVDWARVWETGPKS
ncbi:glycoside hydrolase family 16 protein [Nocardioides sp. STR2]|uniref:Glycoside hydrolase family 16 protein n=1 Tax=Nocardioides pini TaxID=2975053 RepID=A0ABT4CCB7_9ACTN|nr:glycoside hydrolase family 16 protein [Nocardioides pini]MCY4726605.1 glycoside hydrolase family 16 protein [Nocardioides pini]